MQIVFGYDKERHQLMLRNILSAAETREYASTTQGIKSSFHSPHIPLNLSLTYYVPILLVVPSKLHYLHYYIIILKSSFHIHTGQPYLSNNSSPNFSYLCVPWFAKSSSSGFCAAERTQHSLNDLIHTWFLCLNHLKGFTLCTNIEPFYK